VTDRERESGNRERGSGSGDRKGDARRTVLRGGRVIDPSQNLDATGDLILEDGKTGAFETAAGSSCRIPTFRSPALD